MSCRVLFGVEPAARAAVGSSVFHPLVVPLGKAQVEGLGTQSFSRVQSLHLPPQPTRPMALIPCPHCALPRAEEDILRGIACPVCLNRTDEEPAATTPSADEVLSTLAPAPPPKQSYAPYWFLAGALFGFVLFGVAFLLLYNPHPDVVPSQSKEGPLPVAQGHKPVVQNRELLPSPHDPPEVLPSPVLASDEPKSIPIVIPPGGQSVIRLDRPTEIFHLPAIAEGNRVKLVGKVSKLIVEGVSQGAEVDASELVAVNISVTGKVEGGSTLKVNAAGGHVMFTKAVDGASRISVNAPQSMVTFARASPKNDGAKIDGGSQVTITCKTAMFTASIAGKDTKVAITFSAGGALRFTQLLGTAKLHYKQANPNDATVRVTPGQISDTAECKKVD